MRKIIHKIRQQPEEVRTHILHILITIFAVILVFLWLYSLGKNLNNGDIQAKAANELRPLSALKDNLVGGYQSFTNSDQNKDLNTQ